MRITMVGAGYVGLVSGACLADFGHDVTCVDRDPARLAALARGEAPIYEPGLEALMAKGAAAGRLRFTGDLAAAVAAAEVVFIAVGTPARRGDGRADLTHVHAAAREIATAMTAPGVVAIKSTAPVGSNRAVAQAIAEARPDLEIDVVSNPEFLREGAAIEDFMRPDRVVVGAASERARATMRRVYGPLSLRDTPLMFTTPESAELIKYAANAFLAMKITFINEVADLCERAGADAQEVARGIGLDQRIGAKFLHPGPGYGGSCFPKDTSALAQTARDAGAPMQLVETTIAVNAARKRAMVDRIAAALDHCLSGRRITVFGVTFKPETDDMRDAPALVVVPALIGAGAQVTLCDPHGEREGAALLPGARWTADPLAAAAGADAVVVLTEWNMFRGLDLAALRAAMAGDVLVDLRNIYRHDAARAAGLRLHAVGKPDAP